MRRRGPTRGRWVILVVAAAAGLAVASTMLWIAFQENPQGELLDPETGAVDWLYSMALFGLWFVVVAAPTLAVGPKGVRGASGAVAADRAAPETGAMAAAYQALVEASPDAIVMADREGRIRIWNAGAQRVFGHAPAAALGSSLDLIIPERQRERHWQGWERVMESGETRYGDQLLAVPALHADGRRISIEFSVGLIRDERGAVTGVVAILRDVTERWERERSSAS